MGKQIFRVSAGTPPETVRTMEQWMAWRQQEDQRMLNAAAEFMQSYVDAMFEQQQRTENGDQPH